MKESDGRNFKRTGVDLEVPEGGNDGARLVIERREDESKSAKLIPS